MRKDSLLYEIKRIQELNGVRVIKENFTLDVIDDIIKFTSKMIGKVSDDTAELIGKLSKATSDSEALDIIVKLARQSEEISNYIVPKLLETLSASERQALLNVKNYLETNIKNKTIDVTKAREMTTKWVDQNVATPFEGVKTVIKKDFQDYIDNLVRKADEPTVPPRPDVLSTTNVKQNVTSVSGKKWADVQPLTNPELRELEKRFRARGPGSSFMKLMRNFAKSVVDMMTSQYKMMDETLSLIKTMTEESTNAAQKADLQKRIGENIKTLTQKETENFAVIENWMSDNLGDYVLKNKIKGLEGYKKAAAIFDKTAYKQWEEAYDGFFTRRLKLIKQTNSMLNPRSWFAQKHMEKFGPGLSRGTQIVNKWKAFVSGPEFAELRRYIRLGQTQSWKGNRALQKEFGFLPGIGNVAAEWVYSYVALSVILGVLDYIGDILGNFTQNVPLLKDWSVLQNQVDEYNKHFGDQEKYTGFAKPLMGIAHLLGDVGTLSLENFKDLNLAIPGLLDNFGAFLEDLRTAKVTPEEVERLQQSGEVLQDRVENELDTIRNRTEPIVDRVKSELDKFKDFAKDNSIPTDVVECYSAVGEFKNLDTNRKRFLFVFTSDGPIQDGQPAWKKGDQQWVVQSGGKWYWEDGELGGPNFEDPFVC